MKTKNSASDDALPDLESEDDCPIVVSKVLEVEEPAVGKSTLLFNDSGQRRGMQWLLEFWEDWKEVYKPKEKSNPDQRVRFVEIYIFRNSSQMGGSR